MSDIYNDMALVILNGTGEAPVTANLRKVVDGLRTDWDGVLTAAPQHHVVLANTTSARLRLKDGREGVFVCLDPSTWITTGHANIQGSGDAPF